MIMVEEEPQNNNINSNDSELKNGQKLFSSNNEIYTRNFLHIIVNTIIHIGLLIIIIIEFVVRSNNDYTITNFDILVLIFILFDCLFIIANYISSQINYLKGMIYYPFVTAFWALGDFLSLFINNNVHKWNGADTLKTTKFSLIGLNLFINIFYLLSCRNKN